jgi:2-polyprenyl-3-methyl-5-hydroxy-6-metoxy-1,4-benzoquinol methylase
MSLCDRSSDRVFKACPLCGEHTAHRTLFEKWGYPILCCPGCGLAAAGVPDQFVPAAIYSRDYFQGKARDGYADYLGSENVLRRQFRHSLAHLRRYAPKGRLLEIGCAYGFFLMEAARFYHAVGVDISQDAVDFARSRGLNAYQGIADADFLRSMAPWEAVVMLDVIEHLPDPANVLAAVSGAMAKGGCLLITTGDWGSLTARLTGRYWRLMTPPQHLYFFSRRTLAALLEKAGLKLVDCRKPWKMVPLGLAAYQVARRFGVKLPFPSWMNRLGIPLNLFDAMQVIACKM